MKQQFLQVWRNGELWYEFPADNEDNVRADLIKRNLDRECDIKPAGLNVEVLKESVKQQVTTVDLTASKPTPKETKPKAVKATTK
jgi:hypothetical protein